MRMKLFCLAFLFGLLVPCQVLYADDCDDAYEAAASVRESARQALNEKEYGRAAGLYEEAAEEYEEVSRMRNCRCPKVAGAAQNGMNDCRAWADKCRNWADEQGVVAEYDRARGRYNEGNAYARNQDWDNAVYAFEEAAEIWESIAGSGTENGRRAEKGARQARGAAELARRYQQQEY